jgi:AcrR family transcriptional regulator
MAPERRTSDWAAWMGTPASARPVPDAEVEPAAALRAPASGHAVPVERTAPPAPASPAHAGEAAAAGAVTDSEADAEHAHGARSARREATRQRVLDAAREIFAERGVIGGSVEDICERAGFTRGAFYSNFTDKDDVVRALVEREQSRLLLHLDASLEAVGTELAAAPDLESVLGSIVDRIIRSIPVDRQLMLVQTELEIHAIRRPDLSRHLLEINLRFRERLGVFIAAAMERHGRELLVTPADLTDTVLAVAERSVRRGLLTGGDADPDEMAAAVLPGILLALSRPIQG